MKRVIYATLLVLLLFSPTASAHTSLTNSSPADGDVITEEIHEIVLEFNTKIESTSTLKVFNEMNEEVVSHTEVNDHVMTSGFMEPVDNGTYTVEWKIIGADGHPIQDTYSFMVSREDKNLAELENDEEIPFAPNENLEEKIVQPIEAPSKIASNDVLVVILVILFTLAGGFIGWFIGRRQK